MLQGMLDIDINPVFGLCWLSLFLLVLKGIVSVFQKT